MEKCYENPEEKHVIKKLLNQDRGRSELSFYSLCKKYYKI